MKRQILFISLIVSIFFVSACSKKPVSDFTWSPLEPVAGEEVKFINLSQNARTFDWNFGDMSVGRKKSPTHVYKKQGTYIIDLLVHNGLLSNEKTVTIVVK